VPREADPGLRERILDAAQDIWSAGGEEALTMRAVARRAATTTPTLYARFADKEAILRALRSRAVQRLDEWIRHDQSSVRAGCARYLDFAAQRPHDYALLFGEGWLDRTSPEDEMRPLDLLQGALVERLGGTPEQQLPLALTIWALLHGTAMLTLTADPAWRDTMRQHCLQGVDALVNQADQAHSRSGM
jgi:AcrR family transcriptional regulator